MRLGADAQRRRRGWFATDDIGRVDAAGRVVVESRWGTIINVAGSKVVPREVELALLGLPGVREAAVVGRQRDTGTEEVWACLSRPKLPRHLVMVERLPRTATGKVRLGELLASAGRPDDAERLDDRKEERS